MASFEFFTAVMMKVQVLRDVVPSGRIWVPQSSGSIVARSREESIEPITGWRRRIIRQGSSCFFFFCQDFGTCDCIGVCEIQHSGRCRYSHLLRNAKHRNLRSLDSMRRAWKKYVKMLLWGQYFGGEVAHVVLFPPHCTYFVQSFTKSLIAV